MATNKQDEQLAAEKVAFYKLAKNRNKYKVLKPIKGELSYAKIGDTYFSDTLYERGYNMDEMVKTGHLELVERIFPFEYEIVGKNVKSVFTKCPEGCGFGINAPLNKQCGNCGYTEGITYYDAETIHNYIVSLQSTEDKKRIAELEKELGLLKIELSHKSTLLQSCETALSDRDKELAEVKSKAEYGLKILINELEQFKLGVANNVDERRLSEAKAIYEYLSPIQLPK